MEASDIRDPVLTNDRMDVIARHKLTVEGKIDRPIAPPIALYKKWKRYLFSNALRVMCSFHRMTHSEQICMNHKLSMSSY